MELILCVSTLLESEPTIEYRIKTLARDLNPTADDEPSRREKTRRVCQTMRRPIESSCARELFLSRSLLLANTAFRAFSFLPKKKKAETFVLK